jgi:site-specific DNA-methyltransferase (adenine-specific)
VVNLPKPYYQDEAVTIYHADAREILPLLEPGSVDLVLTDPPYGVGLADWDNLPHWDWLDECQRISPLILFTPGIANLWKYPPADWVIGWAKPGSTRRNGTGGFNHWEPVLQYGSHKWMVDLIYLPACVNHSLDSGDHPSSKPLALYRWLIERVAGHTILDPFMGSGTSLRAAKDLGRKAIGIEIEERYCEIAARRMAQLVLL